MLDFLTEAENERVVHAIHEAELQTSAELRIHIENACKGSALDRAKIVFKHLKMHETEQKNGVLIYCAAHTRRLAVWGGKGINDLVAEDYWDDAIQLILVYFRQKRHADGLIAGVQEISTKLKEFFPYQSGDTNELSNEISYGI
jgi:uncharacterized membrane protein